MSLSSSLKSIRVEFRVWPILDFASTIVFIIRHILKNTLLQHHAFRAIVVSIPKHVILAAFIFSLFVLEKPDLRQGIAILPVNPKMTPAFLTLSSCLFLWCLRRSGRCFWGLLDLSWLLNTGQDFCKRRLRGRGRLWLRIWPFRRSKRVSNLRCHL